MRLDLVALLLFLTAATGAVLIIERFRRRDTGMMVGIPAVWVKLSRIAFPLLLAVVLVRSFLIEPFHIPSGSMEPTLVAGDFILVDKTAFGMRIPDLNLTLISGGTPERGDVVVFRYPRQPGLSYIKRVVGLPGDHVMYRDGHLSLNGMEVAMSEVGDYYSPGHTGAVLLRETLGTVEHGVVRIPGRDEGADDFVVPEGHYYVLGDNRGTSNDSRSWGTVPESHLVGRAMFVWLSWAPGGSPDWDRFGEEIQ
jgi:signal peptidase I